MKEGAAYDDADYDDDYDDAYDAAAAADYDASQGVPTYASVTPPPTTAAPRRALRAVQAVTKLDNRGPGDGEFGSYANDGFVNGAPRANRENAWPSTPLHAAHAAVAFGNRGPPPPGPPREPATLSRGVAPQPFNGQYQAMDLHDGVDTYDDTNALTPNLLSTAHEVAADGALVRASDRIVEMSKCEKFVAYLMSSIFYLLLVVGLIFVIMPSSKAAEEEDL